MGTIGRGRSAYQGAPVAPTYDQLDPSAAGKHRETIQDRIDGVRDHLASVMNAWEASDYLELISRRDFGEQRDWIDRFRRDQQKDNPTSPYATNDWEVRRSQRSELAVLYANWRFGVPETSELFEITDSWHALLLDNETVAIELAGWKIDLELQLHMIDGLWTYGKHPLLVKVKNAEKIDQAAKKGAVPVGDSFTMSNGAWSAISEVSELRNQRKLARERQAEAERNTRRREEAERAAYRTMVDRNKGECERLAQVVSNLMGRLPQLLQEVKEQIQPLLAKAATKRDEAEARLRDYEGSFGQLMQGLANGERQGDDQPSERFAELQRHLDDIDADHERALQAEQSAKEAHQERIAEVQQEIENAEKAVNRVASDLASTPPYGASHEDEVRSILRTVQNLSKQLTRAGKLCAYSSLAESESTP